MKIFTNLDNISDQELVVLIKENHDYIGEVYKRCKKNSLFYLRRTATKSINDEVLEDIFQDAIIVLYEKIIKGDFILTAKLQNYIDRVCYNMLVNYIKQNKIGSIVPLQNDGFIADILEPIENSKEPKFIALEKALEKMKAAGSHCYELLTLFWYHKKSHLEIAEKMNYSNDKTSKKQKSGCQERLRTMSYNELKKI
jgi:RNA polymerase sigma factor (sigma-70 family)